MKTFLNIVMILGLFLTVEQAEAQLARKSGRLLGNSIKFAKDRHQGAVKFGKKQLEKRKERKLKRKERRLKRRANRQEAFKDFKQEYNNASN
jgi:hypothetical protein